MIKAIIFDYFGVICSDEYWQFVKADKNIASDFGQLANDVNRGKLPWQEFLKAVALKTNQPLEKVTALYETERIHPEIVAYAKELGKNYKIGLLTNASRSFIESVLQRAKIDEIFDEIVISSDLGIIKPSPNIYEHILNKMGLEPGEAVLIDDIGRNVEGAQMVGMHAILYRNFPQLQQELKQLLTNTNN